MCVNIYTQDVMIKLLSSIKHERKAVTTATWHLLFGWSDQFLDKRYAKINFFGMLSNILLYSDLMDFEFCDL